MPSAMAGVTVNPLVPLLFITSTVQSKDFFFFRIHVLNYLYNPQSQKFSILILYVEAGAICCEQKGKNITSEISHTVPPLTLRDFSGVCYPERPGLRGNNAVV